MSWFSTAAIAKIHPQDKYYYINANASENTFLRIYHPESVQVDEKSIKRLQRGVNITAIPREIIKAINPCKDFFIKVKVTSHHSSVIDFCNIPLGDVVTNETLKSPEYLTQAIMSGGEPCIDLGKEILILSRGICLQKFTDSSVIDKINKALCKAIYSASSETTSDFILERAQDSSTEGTKESEFKILVSISLAPDAKHNLTSKFVGSFNLPEAAESDESTAPVNVENNS
jgi:hypothetical protein